MLNQPLPHPPTASPWQRLIQGNQAVGYTRRMGQSDYYSTDGYGWTGQVIPHDQRLPGLPFRSHDGSRLYHGDVVTYSPVGATDSRPELRILWLDTDGVIWLAAPNSIRVERLEPHLISDRETQIRTVVNSAYTQAQMWTLFERSHHQLFNVSSSPTFWGVVTGVWMIIGILVSIALQLVWIGGLGPIFSVVGAEVGCLLAFQLRARRQPDWRTRPTVLELSKTAGLTLGAGLALIYALTSLMFGLGLDSSAPHLPVGLAAMAILGALIGAGLPLFTASVLGYHSGSRFDSD